MRNIISVSPKEKPPAGVFQQYRPVADGRPGSFAPSFRTFGLGFGLPESCHHQLRLDSHVLPATALASGAMMPKTFTFSLQPLLGNCRNLKSHSEAYQQWRKSQSVRRAC